MELTEIIGNTDAQVITLGGDDQATTAQRITQLETALNGARDEIERGARLNRDANHRAERAEQDLHDFRRTVGERMAQEAADRDWCSEFDSIMDELGLGEFVRRSMDIEVTFTLTIDNVGPDGPTSDQVDSAASDFVRYHLGRTHWTEID